MTTQANHERTPAAGMRSASRRKSSITMSRILDSAEQLFVENGFNGTSLRMITDTAGVNLASVNYHFGSKDALITEVFNRRFAPYLLAIQRRLEQFNTGHSYSVEDLVVTLIIPLHDLITKNDPGRPMTFIQLCSRMLIEHPEAVKTAIAGTPSHDAVPYFFQIYQPLVPDVPEEEMHFRLFFAIKMIFSAYNGYDVFAVHRSSPDRAHSFNTISQYLVPFLTHALGAPASGSSSKLPVFPQ